MQIPKGSSGQHRHVEIEVKVTQDKMGMGERPDTEPKKEEGKEVVEGGNAGDAKDRLCHLWTFARKGVVGCLDQGWHVRPTTCLLHLKAGMITPSCWDPSILINTGLQATISCRYYCVKLPQVAIPTLKRQKNKICGVSVKKRSSMWSRKEAQWEKSWYTLRVLRLFTKVAKPWFLRL